MTLVSATLLGVLQGLTEFLPVSSSAHLILARAFFGWNAEAFGLAFDVACHVGTLAAVVAYFRRDLAAMAAALPQVAAANASGPARRIRLVVAGTLPVAVAGWLFSGVIERTLRTPLVATLNLAVVALVFLVVERVGSQRRGEHTLTAREAVVIGCVQATALVPGISRSGATIVMAMLLGLKRDEAARFTFVLGIPAILVAAGKEGIELARQGVAPGEWQLFAAGATVSAVVGYLTVGALIRYLGGHSLRPFAWYRLALAGSAVAWWMSGSPFKG